MIREHFTGPRAAARVPAGLVPALAALYLVGIVALFASGRVNLMVAGSLLAGPVVLALAVLRPEWIILVLIAIPPSLISRVPPLQLIMVMLVTLFGFLLQGGLSLGPKTGVYPLVGIIVLAFAMKSVVPADATAAADAMLKFITYYTLLMMAAFHTIVSGRMQIDTFVNALLLGTIGAAVFQPFVGSISSFETIAYNPFRGHFAYLAVMGFGGVNQTLGSPGIGRDDAAARAI